jgi:hypothetical protein
MTWQLRRSISAHELWFRGIPPDDGRQRHEAVPTKKSMLIEGVELVARRGREQGNVRTPRFPAA